MMSGKYKIAAGIDAGSAWTRCVVAVAENGCLRLVGFGESPSQGWAKSRIVDRHAVAASIQAAVAEAERMAQIQIEEVTAGVGGSTIYGSNNYGVYEFGRPREITQPDLTYAAERASRLRLDDDRLLLQVYPQDFTVDGRAGYRHPRGAVCSRVEANVHAVTMSTQEHQALVAAIHEAHLGVEETVFEAMAGAYAAVLREERARGVALIDIGAQSTELIVFDGESVQLASSIPICGDHFTRDVGWFFRLGFDDAQRLKEEYGCALLGLTADSTMIEIPSAEGRAVREATRRELNELLEARAEELFTFVKGELVRAGMEQSLTEGVVLTGGGALLAGMCDMAERVLNTQARNGLTTGIEFWPDDMNSPTWTAAAGLTMYSGRLKYHRERRKVPNLLGISMGR